MKAAALLASSILGAWGAPAFAADTPATASSSAMEEIVVTAQRREESLSRTPVAVAALSARALEQQGIKTEADLQIAVPGLLVRAGQDSNQINYSIRGQSIDTFSFSASAVQPYLNEVPLYTFTTTGFYDLSSVQVLKGPQGTLFGQNVTGGAVLFTSTKPTNEFGGYGSVRVGNYDAKEFQGALNIPIVSEKIMFRGAFDLDRRDGFTKDIVTGDRYGKVHRDSFRGSLVIAPTDSLENALMVDYSRLKGSPTPPVVYSVYEPGSTNNGIPLASTVALFYSPGLDAAIGSPGAWGRYLAAHPNADPEGLVAYLVKQQQRGPFRVALDGATSTNARNFVLSNVTTFKVTDDFQIKNIFGYVTSKTHQNVDIDGTIYGIEGGGRFGETHPIQRYKSKQYSEEIQFQGKALNQRLSYTAGVYYYKLTADIFTNAYFLDLGPDIPVNLTNHTGNTQGTETIAGYAQGTYDLSDAVGLDGLSVTAGFRYTSQKVSNTVLPVDNDYNTPGLANSISDRFKKASWQFGIQEQVNPNLLIYAVTRRSFRTGGFNIFHVQRPGLTTEGGSEFPPEIATDVEAGLKFQGRVGNAPARFNIAAYKEWIKNIQRQVYVVDPGTGQIESSTVPVPEAQIYGLEVDGVIEPVSWLSIGGSFAYTHAEFTKNTTTLFGTVNAYGPFPDAPKVSGSVFTQLTFPIAGAGTLIGRGELYGQSKAYFSSLGNTVVPRSTIPGYHLANFRVELDEIGGTGLSISANLKNAFNKVYYVGGLALGQVLSFNSAVPGAPRTFFLEARYKF
jgi:iron complex outermembrane receptor protein